MRMDVCALKIITGINHTVRNVNLIMYITKDFQVVFSIVAHANNTIVVMLIKVDVSHAL